jgi:hypothetical protein
MKNCFESIGLISSCTACKVLIYQGLIPRETVMICTIYITLLYRIQGRIILQPFSYNCSGKYSFSYGNILILLRV